MATLQLMLVVFSMLCIAVCSGDVTDGNANCGRCNCTVTPNNRWRIDCGSRENIECNYKEIPYFVNISEHAESLNMAGCLGLNLSTNSPFEKYPNLITLDLYNTSLEMNVSVTVKTFTGLKYLKYLNISRNDQFPLTNKSPKALFAEMTSLEELIMYGTTGAYNRNKGYPEAILSTLTSLKELWIDGTNATFGQVFRNLRNLKILRISGDMIVPPWRSLEFCDIGDITNMFGNLIHIQKLHIMKCGVQTIAKDAFSNMTELKYIDFSGNSGLSIAKFSSALSSLPKEVNHIVLNNIEDTYHMQCGVKLSASMAQSMSDLNLTTLSLESNAINSAEDHVFKHLPKSLEHLYLSRNEFELGFYTFYAFHMTNLKTIDFSYNFFTDDYGIWRRNDKKHDYSLNIELSDTESSVIEHQEDRQANTTNAPHTQPNNNSEMRKKRELAHPTKSDRNTKVTEDLLVESDYDYRNRYHYSMAYDNVGHHNGDIECPRGQFDVPPGTLTAYLPPKLTSVDFSFSKLGFPIYQLFFSENNSLTEVKASTSLLYCWEGPVHGLKKLERLDLSLNDCSHVSPDFFTKAPNLMVLNVSWNLLDTAVSMSSNGSLFRNNKKLKELYMSFNHIQGMSSKFLINQDNLEILDLADNGLRSFDLEIKHMTHLKKIDLGNNHISDLSSAKRNEITTLSNSESRRENFTTLVLYLNGNPIECSCNTLPFLRWIYSSNADNNKKLEVRVKSCIDKKNGAMIDIDLQDKLEDIISEFEKKCASYVPVIVCVSIVLAILLNVVVGVTVHRFRWKIRYWYYVTCSQKVQSRNGYISIESDETRYKYHIYVASINDDVAFVMTKLKPRLERDYRLFIQDDDIVPGQNMYSLIANAIHVSKVALFVVSKNCDSDPDWQIAVCMAQEESSRRGHPMYLGIFSDATKINDWSDDMAVIRQFCFMEYPDGADEQEAFWEECKEKIKDIESRQIFSYTAE